MADEAKRTKKGGRPSHEPTDQTRAMVRTMCEHLIGHEDIATAIGIDDNTLRKHYGPELKAARALYKAEVARMVGVHLRGRAAQYNAAGKLIRAEIPPDRAMAMFQAKVVLGQRETQHVEVLIKPEDLRHLSDGELAAYEIIARKIMAAKLGGDPDREGAALN